MIVIIIVYNKKQQQLMQLSKKQDLCLNNNNEYPINDRLAIKRCHAQNDLFKINYFKKCLKKNNIRARLHRQKYHCIKTEQPQQNYADCLQINHKPNTLNINIYKNLQKRKMNKQQLKQKLNYTEVMDVGYSNRLLHINNTLQEKNQEVSVSQNNFDSEVFFNLEFQKNCQNGLKHHKKFHSSTFKNQIIKGIKAGKPEIPQISIDKFRNVVSENMFDSKTIQLKKKLTAMKHHKMTSKCELPKINARFKIQPWDIEQ